MPTNGALQASSPIVTGGPTPHPLRPRRLCSEILCSVLNRNSGLRRLVLSGTGKFCRRVITDIGRRRVNVFDKGISGNDNRFGSREADRLRSFDAARAFHRHSNPVARSSHSVLRRTDTISSGRALFVRHELLYREETLLLLLASGHDETSHDPERHRTLPRRLRQQAGTAPIARHRPDGHPVSLLLCRRN